jgi:hypothetical protein
MQTVKPQVRTVKQSQTIESGGPTVNASICSDESENAQLVTTFTKYCFCTHFAYKLKSVIKCALRKILLKGLADSWYA